MHLKWHYMMFDKNLIQVSCCGWISVIIRTLSNKAELQNYNYYLSKIVSGELRAMISQKLLGFQGRKLNLRLHQARMGCLGILL